MRDPARKAVYCLLALVVAAALIWFGADRERGTGEPWASIAPVFLGFAIAPFALVILIQALFAARGRALLLRGEGVIARWRVYPGEWMQFGELDRRRSAEGSRS